MTSPTTPHSNRRTHQLTILLVLVVFALGLCGLVVFLMLHRGPAVAY